MSDVSRSESDDRPKSEASVPGELDLAGATGPHLRPLAVVATALWFGATFGMVSYAGIKNVALRVDNVDWAWLLAALGGVVIAFLGYVIAYEGVVGPGPGPTSARDRMLIVLAGFGGFGLTGGKAVDRLAFVHSGLSEREARTRVSMLQQFEQLPIALAACASSLAVLTASKRLLPADFTWPWVVATPVGTVIAVTGARLIGERFDNLGGWRGWIGTAAGGIRMLPRALASRPGAVPPVLGMIVYWAGEVFAVWAAIAAFGEPMTAVAVIIGYATGYAITRRSAPLGGAGLIDVLLPLSLWACGAPLAAAVAGVIAYRFFNFWLALLAARVASARLHSVFASRVDPPPTRPQTALGERSEVAGVPCRRGKDTACAPG